MTDITQAQRDLLQAAAAASSGAIDAPQNGGAKIIAARLIKAGLLMSMPLDGGGSRLLITEAGKAAIGAAPTRSPALRDQSQAGAHTAVEGAAPAGVLPKGKLGALVGLLRRDEGATVEQLMAATGWQAHSVRGAISGAVKKKLNLPVASELTDKVRRYRIVEPA